MRQSYRTDLSDEQWELLEDMIPLMQTRKSRVVNVICEWTRWD
jgi:transposase